MGLSLLKTTSNNVSGTYTPACLLNGLFDVTINGDTTIAAPSGIGDGQIFCVNIAIGGSLASSPYSLAWASSYVGEMAFPSGNYSTGQGGCSFFMHDGSIDYLIGSWAHF